MTSVQSPSLTEANSVIRVAIVCEPETTVLANSLEALLERAQGFTFSRFEYRAESDLKRRPVGVANPDVVVATLHSFQATKVQPLLAPLQRAFPNRPLLVTTMHPDAFDVFPLLEAGAADFLLPPLRASDVLPRLKQVCFEVKHQIIGNIEPEEIDHCAPSLKNRNQLWRQILRLW